MELFNKYKGKLAIATVIVIYILVVFKILKMNTTTFIIMCVTYFALVITQLILAIIKGRKKKKVIDPTRKFDSTIKSLIWIIPAVIILILFTYTPLFVVFKNAFNDNISRPADGFSFTWRHFFGGNRPDGSFYQGTFKDSEFWPAVNNSIWYTFVSVPIGLIFAIFISAAITAITPKRVRGFFQTLFFLPYVTSAIAVSMAFAYIFGTGEMWQASILNNLLGTFGLGPIDWLGDSTWSMISVVIFGVWKSLPFSIVILTASMLSIDPDQYKASAIDGAGRFKTLRKITIPLLYPTLIYLLTISFMSAMKVFPLALFGNNPTNAALSGANTIVLYIYAATTAGFKARAGVSSIVLLMIVLVMTKFNRYLRKKVRY